MLRRALAFVVPALAWAQDFSGTWLLDAAASRPAAEAPAKLTVVTTPQGKLACAECGPGGWLFAPDRRTHESAGGGTRNSIMGKWEGTSAMVLNVMTSQGGLQWTTMDHWRLSSDGAQLTIRREVQRGARLTEATFVYLKEGVTRELPAPVAPPAPKPIPQTGPPAPAAPAPVQTIRLEKGARLPLRALSAFSSKTAHEGDRVYLETAQPVARFGRVVLPVGSQVAASIVFVKPSGRVKGRGELMLRFESVTLPNGVTRDFRAGVSGADADAGRVDEEGKIRAAGDKAGDAGQVGKTTAGGAVVGATIGQAAGNTALGAGIGAAAGAAAGLARVLGSRGPEVAIRRGDIVEMSLDRDLFFTEADLR